MTVCVCVCVLACVFMPVVLASSIMFAIPMCFSRLICAFCNEILPTTIMALMHVKARKKEN